MTEQQSLLQNGVNGQQTIQLVQPVGVQNGLNGTVGHQQATVQLVSVPYENESLSDSSSYSSDSSSSSKTQTQTETETISNDKLLKPKPTFTREVLLKNKSLSKVNCCIALCTQDKLITEQYSGMF